VIDPKTLEDDGRVVFGVTVDLEAVETGEEVSYQIVGEDEADIKLGKVSFSSPIARAMIGKSAGDTVEVRAPGGAIEYEIVEVHYV
jgi:transcription elongation factor GreA